MGEMGLTARVRANQIARDQRVAHAAMLADGALGEDTDADFGDEDDWSDDELDAKLAAINAERVARGELPGGFIPSGRELPRPATWRELLRAPVEGPWPAPFFAGRVSAVSAGPWPAPTGTRIPGTSDQPWLLAGEGVES